MPAPGWYLCRRPQSFSIRLLPSTPLPDERLSPGARLRASPTVPRSLSCLPTMARSKNRNPRPAYPSNNTPATRSGPPTRHSLAAAAGIAATMPAPMPQATADVPLAALPAVSPAAQLVGLPVVPSSAPLAVSSTETLVELPVVPSMAPPTVPSVVTLAGLPEVPSLEAPVAPSVQPSTAPLAVVTEAPSIAPSAAHPVPSPSVSPAFELSVVSAAAVAIAPFNGRSKAVGAERILKDEMRVASGNLNAAAARGATAGAPSRAAGSQSATQPRLSGPPASVSMVTPPVVAGLRPPVTRRATTTEKGKGPAKAAKVVMAAEPGAAAPRAARRLAVIAPNPGGKPFATLEFRKERAAMWAASGGAPCSGAGTAARRRPSLAASAKGGVWAVGDQVVRPTPLFRQIVAKRIASVSSPTALDIRQMVTQSSDDDGGLVAPPPSPTSAVMAVVEPTNVLMERIRQGRKRSLARSRSSSADKDGSGAAVATASPQATEADDVPAALVPVSRAAAKDGATVIQKDVNAVLETILTHINDVETRLDELSESCMLVDEKMGAAINLTQQTLMHVAAMGEKLSKELKDGFYKVRFVVSGTTNASVDEAPEKTIDMIRKFLREDLDEDWLYTNVTSEVYPDTNVYWDKAVRATSTAIKSGAEGAEVFLRSMVHLPSRKDPSVYVRMRASVPVLRVKSHMHKWYGELIWAAFATALMPVNQVVTMEIANQLRHEHRYFSAVLGKKACVSAATKLCIAIGAFGRVKEPSVAGDPQVLELTLGHFAFVTMKVRNMIEGRAGERTVTTVGGDGHYSMWVQEVRFLHGQLPKDDEAHDGLRLVDGSSPSRSLPWIGDASSSE